VSPRVAISTVKGINLRDRIDPNKRAIPFPVMGFLNSSSEKVLKSLWEVTAK
jgi:hypothetical protein